MSSSSLYILLATLAVVSCLEPSRAGYYSSRYDGISVEPILKSERLLARYINCLLGKIRCPPEGDLLKRVLSDALQSDCARCTPLQKKKAARVASFLRTNKPTEWKLLLNKYDPEGVYQKRNIKLY